MTHGTDPVSRRSVLRKSGFAVTAVAVGVPAVTGTAAADITQMNVDVPPSISSTPRGRVVTAIYPTAGIAPSEVEQEVEAAANGRFKLGPDFGPDEHDMRPHADAVGWRLVNNGVHGEVLGVFFDSSTADDGGWFEPGDDRDAKLSAVKGDGDGDPSDIIAWGSDSVNIR